jgi:predicted AAA+ superfamily ATPase
MYQRLLTVTKNQSFFLFGARGTGKSTFLKKNFKAEECLWIDLLDPQEESQLSMDPNQLIFKVKALPENIKYVVIDEIQKIPKLLDCIHKLIEETEKKFILTGSSAKKLKHGFANLLAGRAFVYNMFPFSFLEVEKEFKLDKGLSYGLLPKQFLLQDEEEKKLFLQAYAQTYLKEEIWMEQLIRNLNPFRKFLEVAAQCNGKIINYSNIANDVGVDDKTVRSYFQILEETLVGFFLESHHNSIRKRLSQKPKFYFFDTGVCRTLARMLSVPIQTGTSYYGECFEHFVICEIMKLCSYYYNEYKLSYFQTKDGVEIDLVVERPAQKTLCIEIKSTQNLTENDISSFLKLSDEFPNSEFVCLSTDPAAKQIGNVKCTLWSDGIKSSFLPDKHRH